MPPILHEATSWKKPRAANRTRRTSDLTPDEQANVRAALRVLRLRLGGYRPLGEALGCNWTTIRKMGSAKGPSPSAGVAVRVARLAQVPADAVGRSPP